MINAMLWSIRRIPPPCSSRTVRTASARSDTSASGRPAAGSSRSRKRGLVASARATPRRRSSPWASVSADASAWLVSPSSSRSWAARLRALRGRAPTPRAATSTFSRTESARKAWLCWKVRASPCLPRRPGCQRVTSRPSSSTVPALGRSNPVSTLTSVDLPAPFGPIRPTTSPRRSSRLTSRRAWTPSNERDTTEARSVSPGLRVLSSALARATRRLDFRDDLGDDSADNLRHVVLDSDHAVPAAEHGVQLRREADVARDRRHVLELLHHPRQIDPLRRSVRALDRRDDSVDRGRPRDEAAGAGLDLLRQRVDRLARVVPEGGREGHEPVVRHLRIGRQPIGSVACPRVEDRRVVP